MATYEIVPSNVPGGQKTTRITGVAAGDRIDIEEILRRPARGMKLYATATTDVIQFKLNNLVRLRKFEETQADTTVEVWSGSPRYATFSVTGYTEHETQEELRISSIDIVALTLSVGTTIEIVVW